MRRFHFSIACLVLVGALATACGGSDTRSETRVPTEAARAGNVTPTATRFVVNPGSVRRVPTLAPTATATQVPTDMPTEIPTGVPTNAPTDAPTATLTPIPIGTATATSEPQDTSTAVPAVAAAATATNTRPPATATPDIPPGVYVTAFRIDPPAPKSKPAEFFFTVDFLNTVGEPVNYPSWRVLVFRKGETKSIGDPQGVSKTIANQASQQRTMPASINVSACEPFVAQPVWQDEEGRRIPLNRPDGSSVTYEFQVCPP